MTIREGGRDNLTRTDLGRSGLEARAPRSYRAPPPPGGEVARLAQYEVIRELGRGGMGVVYLARDERLGRKVALKLLQTSHAELTRRFLIEARATARCSHENIVVIYEVGEHDGSPFMVLEYLEGQPLSSLLATSSPLSPSRAVEIMAPVVRALACAHEHGIVHRDLKPDNVFLTNLGTLKVLDFGIAKVLGGELGPEALLRGIASDERATGIAGTLLYMSPEQWGVGEIDHQTDIWASGVVLFEMLAGQHPLAALGDAVSSRVARLDLPMPSLTEAAPSVPPLLAAVVDRCLAKRKAERFPDAASLLRALEPFLSGRPSAVSGSLDRGPYAGLRAFQEEDADRFFGRDREIAALATRVRDYPLLAVVGPSGIGKSSLLRAGVIPTLKASGESWSVLVARPGRDPVLALAALLAPLVSSSPTVSEDLGAQRELAQRLRLEPGYFGSALRACARRSGGSILLFVDQFEELHTLSADPAERRAFTACISGAADDAASPVRVVLSLRADFLGHTAEDPHFMNELARGLFFLGPLEPDSLERALLRPAQNAGYRFESMEMVQDMVAYLAATPAGLPLLQFTAAQLWDQRDAARKLLTLASYRQLGGIAGALVTHANRVLAELSIDRQRLCRDLFLHLVTQERTRAVRDFAELAELLSAGDELTQLVQLLVEARLLVVQGGSEGDSAIEIVHESLIASWPTLRRWLEESHEDSVYLDQLLAAARQWHSRRRDPGLLWRGETADELERFRRRYQGEWPDVTREFARAITAEQTRSSRRRRWLVGAALVSMTALLAAASVALIIISRARREAEGSARAATLSGEKAGRRLKEVQEKEAARAQAEQQRLLAEKQVKRTGEELERSNVALVEKNTQLSAALLHTDEERRRAEQAQAEAQQNESAARSAEERARHSAEELAMLLQKEKARGERLTREVGVLVEELK